VPSNQIAEGFEFYSLIGSQGYSWKLQELRKMKYRDSTKPGLWTGPWTGLWNQ